MWLSAFANLKLGVGYSWKRWMGEEYLEQREKIWWLHGWWKPVVAWIQMSGPKQAGDWSLSIEMLEQREVSSDLLGTPRRRTDSVFTWIVGLGFCCFSLVLGFLEDALYPKPRVCRAVLLLCEPADVSSHLQSPVAVYLHAGALFVLKTWLWVCMCSRGYGEGVIGYLKKRCFLLRKSIG